MREAGQRLLWAREILGLTQAEVGDLIGVTKDAVGLYERGLRWPDEFRALKMLSKLKISRAYLVEGSLQGVDRELAILLAAAHPELARPRDRASDTDTPPPGYGKSRQQR